MLMTEVLSRIEDDIRRTYGDVENPRYHRIAELLRLGPEYSDLRPLIERYYVKESTDENYDYCFSFSVKFSRHLIGFELSVVGPYFCVFSIEDRNIQVMEREALDGDVNLSDAFSHLMEKRDLLGRRELETLVCLNTEESESGKVRIYNALFSASSLPWF